MRAVAHIDANYFYGQVEALFRPDVRGQAFIVGGDQESRKGIVLTKSPPAKKMGIKTGSSVREALGIAPNLIVLPANYPLYLYFSHRMREIVLEHTDCYCQPKFRPQNLNEKPTTHDMGWSIFQRTTRTPWSVFRLSTG